MRTDLSDIPPIALDALPEGVFLTEIEATVALRFRAGALRKMRREGRAPKYSTLPGGWIRYRAGDLLAFTQAG